MFEFMTLIYEQYMLMPITCFGITFTPMSVIVFSMLVSLVSACIYRLFDV